jgi:surface antigen
VYAPPPRVVYAPAPVVYAPQVSAVPTRDFRDAEGRYCREYQRTAIINGVEQPVYGTACLMPDGAWRIASE